MVSTEATTELGKVFLSSPGAHYVDGGFENSDQCAYWQTEGKADCDCGLDDRIIGIEQEAQQAQALQLAEAVSRLRALQFQGNPAPSEYFGVCVECKATGPEHLPQCQLGLFLARCDDLLGKAD